MASSAMAMALRHEDDGAFAMRSNFRTSEIKGLRCGKGRDMPSRLGCRRGRECRRGLQNRAGGAEEENEGLGRGGSSSAYILAGDSADGSSTRGSEEGQQNGGGRGKQHVFSFCKVVPGLCNQWHSWVIIHQIHGEVCNMNFWKKRWICPLELNVFGKHFFLDLVEWSCFNCSRVAIGLVVQW